jgi:PAS domain S-box-containing protein
MAHTTPASLPAKIHDELDDFFENAPIGLHWVDRNGIIVRVNRAELSMLGYDEREYLGRSITEFHADQDVIHDILRRLTSGETLHNYEARLRCKDGSIKHVLISSNVLWQDGEFIHTRCFTRDITERKQTELERERLILELRKKQVELEKAKELLQEKVRDLEIFHDVAVSRELRMMAQEKELETLRAEVARLRKESPK